MIYLFLGHDRASKNKSFQKLLTRSVPAGTRHFNCDILYADELKLNVLQERLKSLPVNSRLRVVVIKSAQKLKKDIQQYILNYAEHPYKRVILVLDAEPKARHDAFLKSIAARASVERSEELPRVDAFTLCRQIESRRCAEALRILKKLLDSGEKPERILGGLRYAWERGPRAPSGSPVYRGGASRGRTRPMRLLLECDKNIKTGRLKPQLALEKLIIALSG
ncbi:MAG: hypothetical protein MJA29_12745 [Candidatus Omnitrophica bacterium]|nr:hypothetical protein [Candidatus Omnitrophota bacterium]